MPTLAISTVLLKFKDVAGVVGNRRIKRSSSLTGVDGQTTVGASFQDPDIKYLPSPDVACNKRHTQKVPSDVGNGQFKLGADPLRRYRDICAQAEAGSVDQKSCRRRRITEDDDSFTFNC